MKHTLLLHFKSKSEAMEFLGQLSDGFGEEYVNVHPSDSTIVHWDDTTEFDVELVDPFSDELESHKQLRTLVYGEGDDISDVAPPVDPHNVTERLTKAIKNVERTRKEIFGDWEEGDDE